MMNIEDVKRVINYDPLTGIFTWKVRRGGIAAPGIVAGSLNEKGYVCIDIFRKKIKAHRLAWFYTHGEWPEFEIDHVNTIKSDNRILNLRLSNHHQNAQNLRKARSDNKTGLLGVYKIKNKIKPCASQIRLNNKKIFLGYFYTAIDAHEAYLKAKRELHEYCTI